MRELFLFKWIGLTRIKLTANDCYTYFAECLIISGSILIVVLPVSCGPVISANSLLASLLYKLKNAGNDVEAVVALV